MLAPVMAKNVRDSFFETQCRYSCLGLIVLFAVAHSKCFAVTMICVCVCVFVASTQVIVACKTATVWLRAWLGLCLCYRTLQCLLSQSVVLTGMPTNWGSVSAPHSIRLYEFSLSQNSKLSELHTLPKNWGILVTTTGWAKKLIHSDFLDGLGFLRYLVYLSVWSLAKTISRDVRVYTITNHIHVYKSTC